MITISNRNTDTGITYQELEQLMKAISNVSIVYKEIPDPFLYQEGLYSIFTAADSIERKMYYRYWNYIIDNQLSLKNILNCLTDITDQDAFIILSNIDLINSI